MNTPLPKALIEAIQYFADPKVCVEFVKNLVFEDGEVFCRKCGNMEVTALSTRQLWQCKGCRKQFSVKVNTIFEDSPISLSKWLVAVWLITNAKNGISSYEIHRAIGVTQKTAWFLLHRIRHAMAEGSFVKLSGVVESDETWVGGSEKHKHVTKQMFKRNGRKDDKTLVMGMLERGGRVVAKVVDNQTKPVITAEVRKHVEAGATLYTDALHSYRSLAGEYNHDFTDHRIQYVRGPVHSNSIEGFWSLLKRSIKGTYTHIEPFHLNAYLNEQALRYNLRKGNDFTRFNQVVGQVAGRRLTWKQLTA